MINIQLSTNKNNDQYYRYKRPIIDLEIAGKGNGKFTIINNIDNISEELNHPSYIILKYIGSLLGCSSNNKNNTIKGHYNQSQIEKCISSYVDNFVLCSNCKKPEIKLRNEGKKKKIKIFINCSTCGYNGELIPVNINFDKGKNLLINHLKNNEWKIKKGTIVEQKNLNPFLNP